MKNPRKSQKARYSDIMSSYTEDERKIFWSAGGEVYRGEYIDPNDEKAFQSKKEVDDFKKELVKFWEHM